MESARRRYALKEAGIDHGKERQEIDKAVQKEQQRQAKAQQKKEEMLKNPLFSIMNTIKNAMDNWLLDPIIGFVFPEVGDVLSAVCALPFIYFSLFKVKSLRLTLACTYNTLVDMIIGLVPFLGDLLDAFHQSYRKNLNLIVGYVNNDKETKSEVNRKSALAFFALAVFIGMLYLIHNILWSIFSFRG